jgi:uncharacterized membrane protein YjjP (DUF1212 family)
VQAGTLGGTLCSIWNSLDWTNVLHTMLMAAVGAIVSYLVSKLLDRGKKK